MIIRMIVVDPRPRSNESDLRVYQVPENSREQELLQELCNNAGLECVAVVGPRPVRKAKKCPK